MIFENECTLKLELKTNKNISSVSNICTKQTNFLKSNNCFKKIKSLKSNGLKLTATKKPMIANDKRVALLSSSGLKSKINKTWNKIAAIPFI
jgi:hypothetical protein